MSAFEGKFGDSAADVPRPGSRQSGPLLAGLQGGPPERWLACLTDWVPKRRAAMTHRQIVGFGWTAAVVVLVLAFLQTQSGTVQAVGFVVGLPVILVLLVISLRMVRSRGPRSN